MRHPAIALILAAVLAVPASASTPAPRASSATVQTWSGWSCSASGAEFILYKTLQRAAVSPEWLEMKPPVFVIYTTPHDSKQLINPALFAEARTARKLEAKDLIWLARLDGKVISPLFWPAGLSGSFPMNAIPPKHVSDWRLAPGSAPIEIELADPGVALTRRDPVLTKAVVDARKLIGTYRLQKAGLPEAWAAGEAAMRARRGNLATAPC